MRYAITIDFGSTFTKVVVTDLAEKRILLTEKVPSTVGEDAAIGMEQCFQKAREVLGEQSFGEAAKLATSSAAGGLRMSVIGLTRSLSSLAGRSAALGAGAKIIGNYVGRFTEEKACELTASNTEIVLFSGGYERGNSEMVLENARVLAASDVRVPIIYAGNTSLSSEVRTMMRSRGKTCYTVENIIPRLGVLNVEPTQEVIRNLFLERITDMKGFRQVKRCFDNDMMPTPAAVLAAGELLNRGTVGCPGLGDLMIVDVGGATTDVYSFNANESYGKAQMIGLEEPFGKRTVEGDLGMRENSGGVIEQEGFVQAAENLGITEDALRSSIERRITNHEYLPDTAMERQIDDAIAKTAVRAAARRHAGRIAPAYERKGQFVQTGKNLTGIRTVIGTGGILVFNEDPEAILKEVVKKEKDKNILLPEQVEVLLDTEYVLFSAGLLREIEEEAALAVMQDSIRPCLRSGR